MSARRRFVGCSEYVCVCPFLFIREPPARYRAWSLIDTATGMSSGHWPTTPTKHKNVENSHRNPDFPEALCQERERDPAWPVLGEAAGEAVQGSL